MTRGKRAKLTGIAKTEEISELKEVGNSQIPSSEKPIKVPDHTKPATSFNGHEAMAPPQPRETSLVAPLSAREKDAGTEVLEEQQSQVPVGEHEPTQSITSEAGEPPSEVTPPAMPSLDGKEPGEERTDETQQGGISADEQGLLKPLITESKSPVEIQDKLPSISVSEEKGQVTESHGRQLSDLQTNEKECEQPTGIITTEQSSEPPAPLLPERTDKGAAGPGVGEPQQIRVSSYQQENLQLPAGETAESPVGQVAKRLRKPSIKKGTQKKRSFAQPEYRPPVLTPSTRTTSTSAAPQPLEAQSNNLPGQTGIRSLPIEVRVVSERGGFYTISLLPKRSSDLPEELYVKTRSGTLQLEAMQDEWYQDIYTADIGSILRDGVVWYEGDEKSGHRWALSGREVYVLSDRSDLRGFISQTRLMLGHSHIVLCTESRLPEVTDIIHKTGAVVNEIADASRGVPKGWLAILGIKPDHSMLPGNEVDILNILCPLPGVEIGLENGIRLEYLTWLEGYPPVIRVYGEASYVQEVTIDGRPATLREDGSYSIPGYDSAGSHQVWCSGTSKTYSIEKREPGWSSWDAHIFTVQSPSKIKVGVCGSLVRQCTPAAQVSSILLPEMNPIAVGANPGEVLKGSRCSNLRFAPFVASPTFDPVWALPSDPLRYKKDAQRIVLIGKPKEVVHHKRQRKLNKEDRTTLLEWSRAILDAGRKGLATEPDTEEVKRVWRSYKKEACSVRRVLK